MAQYSTLAKSKFSPREGYLFEVGSLWEYLSRLHERRDARGKVYALATVLVIIILAKLSGEDSLRGIAEWLAERQDELIMLLALRRPRTPSRATLTRLLASVLSVKLSSPKTLYGMNLLPFRLSVQSGDKFWQSIQGSFQMLFRFFQYFISRSESVFLRLIQPARSSLGLSAATDFTRSRSQLIAENALLRQQLIILSRKSKKPRFTRSDRLSLVLLASRVQHWRSSLLILQPDTLLPWHREGFRLFWKFKSPNRGGRPRLSAETVALIQQMAKDNRLWGSERIRGELRKLGIWVATATVQKYVRAVRPTHSPGQNWFVFLQNHAQDVWACDFLPVIDLFLRPVYVFFIIELASRRVIHFNVTHRPTDAWAAQQLREATPHGQTPRFLICDRDRKYCQAFAALAKESSIEIWKTPYWAPRANAICERFLGNVRRECLDHMLIFGERHMYQVIKEYVQFFNGARPHQGIEQKIPEESRSGGRSHERERSSLFPFSADCNTITDVWHESSKVAGTGTDDVFGQHTSSYRHPPALVEPADAIRR